MLSIIILSVVHAGHSTFEPSQTTPFSSIIENSLKSFSILVHKMKFLITLIGRVIFFFLEVHHPKQILQKHF